MGSLMTTVSSILSSPGINHCQSSKIIVSQTEIKLTCLYPGLLLISGLYFSPFFHMAHMVANRSLDIVNLARCGAMPRSVVIARYFCEKDYL